MEFFAVLRIFRFLAETFRNNLFLSRQGRRVKLGDRQTDGYIDSWIKVSGAVKKLTFLANMSAKGVGGGLNAIADISAMIQVF